MNIFIYQNNLQIKRRDAFQLTQEEAYKNISQRFIAILLAGEEEIKYDSFAAKIITL